VGIPNNRQSDTCVQEGTDTEVLSHSALSRSQVDFLSATQTLGSFTKGTKHTVGQPEPTGILPYCGIGDAIDHSSNTDYSRHLAIVLYRY